MDNDIQKKINALKITYANTLNDKMFEIRASWLQLKTAWDNESISYLYRLLHNLHGSSGTYGYQEIASISRELEQMVAALQKTPRTQHTQELFEEKLNVLYQLMNTKTIVLEVPSSSAGESEKLADKCVYILDGGQSHLNSNAHECGEGTYDLPISTEPSVKASEFQIMNRSQQLLDNSKHYLPSHYSEMNLFGYETHFFDNVSVCMQAIAARKPDVLIVSINLLSSSFQEYLQQFLQDNSDTLVLVSAKEGSVANRLKAVRCGAQAYMIEPFTIEELLSTLDDFFKVKKLDYNILIVDDSPEVAQYYALILQQAGMNVAVISEPMHIDQSLFIFNPDLILMDMYMPECNGLEVVAIIRQQENYASIPIVFLSSEEDREKQLKAMRLGVDDFISKSTRTDFLILSIINRVERYRMLRGLITKDSLTGVLNHTEIQKRLSIHLKEASRLNTTLCTVMIDLDHFKTVNDNYGHQMGDRVLKNLCLLLKKRLRASDDIGRQGGEEFLIILPNTTLENARTIVDNLREQFAKISYVYEDKVFNVTFSAGVASYPDYLNNNALIQAADLALYAAKKWGRNRMCLAGS